MLEMRNLSAGYGELGVLEALDLDVAKGEIVALIGPNGAGKSTVLKAIFNIATITQGTLYFLGKDIRKMKTYELLGLGISYVPQGKINFSDLSVEENLRLGAQLQHDEVMVKRSLERVYARFGILKSKKNDLAFSLSGGQQQMLALGRALMQQPKLLLMDEPTLGLSPKLQQELFRSLVLLRDEEGISILIVEQNAKKAIEIADRTYLLETGRVVLSGGKEIIDNAKIQEIYLGGRK